MSYRQSGTIDAGDGALATAKQIFGLANSVTIRTQHRTQKTLSVLLLTALLDAADLIA